MTHAVRRPGHPARTWPLALAFLALASTPAFVVEPAVVLAGLLWVVPPYVAAVAWASAGCRLRWGRSAAGLRTMAVAASIGAALQLGALYGAVLPAGDGVGPGTPGPAGWLAISGLMMVGAGLMLAPTRGGASGATLVVDTLLLLLVAVVLALRLVVEPLLALGAEPGDLLTAVAQQGVVLAAVVVAGTVVLRRASALAPRSAVLLLLATLALAAGSLAFQASQGVRGEEPGGAPFYFWVAGWVLFGLGGLEARRLAATPRGMLARRRTLDRLRSLLVPGAALLLAVAVLDLGLGPTPRLTTVVAVALLAGMLALRTAHAVMLAERDAEQRRRLAHTQALVAVTHSLAGTTDLDATLRVISEAARSAFGTKGAGIELVTEDGRGLETRAAVGMPDGILGMRFPIEGSFTGWVVRHGEPRASLDPSLDPYIQPQSLAFLGRSPVAAAPIRFRGQTLGALFACIRDDPFHAEELQLLGAMAEQAAIAIQNARLFEQVTILSMTDPLTGLANRRQLERELARDFAAARRGRDLAAVLFDLDDFKTYNDTHGHLAGDEALQTFAAALQDETRVMNLAARYGGDEFVVLLSDTDAPGAAVFVERVRNRFDLEVSALGHGELTLSAGVAVYDPAMESPDALLRAADAALYRDKPRVRT